MNSPLAEIPCVAVSAALTWDGARYPATRRLPPVVRHFLAKSRHPVLLEPSSDDITRVIQEQRLAELRVAWVPLLTGDSETLLSTEPITKRVPFRLLWSRNVQRHLLAIYRPAS